jgi:D-alanyl-lipoteichoic acid acyltransferase DltB (MBOAT superfamily)
MSFVSFSFLFLFAAVLGLRLTIGWRKTGFAYLAALICASTVFYSWHIPIYLGLLLGSTLLDFFVARRIVHYAPRSAKRRAFLVLSLVGNLGVLGIFKYGDFLIETLTRLVGSPYAAVMPRGFDLALPLGISFYTFQSLSYTIDVYRGTIRPVAKFWQLFLFVSFFPQLVAGPIVRARDFLYQIGRRRRVNFRVFSEGAYLIVRGFFLKMVCANNLAPFVETIFSRSESQTNSSVLILGALFFGCQIFCDFAGYSSIARGLAYVLGFRLPVNFNNPYLATTFSEFWRRWHITLSQWLRDFLYVPLGGNRRSPRRTFVNLMIVMLLGGLWHGAAWNYVIWGAIHGSALAAERLLGLHRPGVRTTNQALRLFWFACVQGVVFMAWIVFRSPTLDAAGVYLMNLFAGELGAVSTGVWFPLVFCAPVMIMHLRGLLADRVPMARVAPIEKAILAAVMLIATLTFYGVDSDFIYFQF